MRRRGHGAIGAGGARLCGAIGFPLGIRPDETALVRIGVYGDGDARGMLGTFRTGRWRRGLGGHQRGRRRWVGHCDLESRSVPIRHRAQSARKRIGHGYSFTSTGQYGVAVIDRQTDAPTAYVQVENVTYEVSTAGSIDFVSEESTRPAAEKRYSIVYFYTVLNDSLVLSENIM